MDKEQIMLVESWNKMEEIKTIDIIMSASSLVTAIVAVVTIIFVYRQIKDLSKNIFSQTYQNIYERMIEIDRYFIDNPDLKKYFYYNEKIPQNDLKLKTKLYSIAEMMVDYFDSVYYQRDCMRRKTFEAKAFYFGDVCNNSPILREYLNQPGIEKWYAKDFLEFLKRKTNEVKRYLGDQTDKSGVLKKLEVKKQN